MTDVPFEFQLWDAETCAGHFGLSKEHFLKKKRHEEGFPAPVKSSSEGHPRWRALAVAQWAIK